MSWKSSLIVLGSITTTLLAPPAGTAAAQDAPQAGCVMGEKIDGSTADGVRKKLEAAGYQDVRALKKGCDNVWHASARKDGTNVNVILAPDGQIFPDGD